MLLKSFEEKKLEILNEFTHCNDNEEIYHKIILLGKSLKKLSGEFKTEQYLVSGCQSIMYLRAYQDNDRVYFEADSDALISAGLAALLISVYSGEKAEVILKENPNYLKEINANLHLTANRSNGLFSIFLKMQQYALSFIVQTTKSGNG